MQNLSAAKAISLGGDLHEFSTQTEKSIDLFLIEKNFSHTRLPITHFRWVISLMGASDYCLSSSEQQKPKREEAWEIEQFSDSE